MFTVYHSNQLDILKTLAAYHIECQPLRDPFQPEIVLVQSPGMAQWLQIALAEHFAIAANIQFPLPASFIWDMFVRVLPDIPKESAFTKASMSWKLMALMPEMLIRPEFALMRHYLREDKDKRKLFQLAAKVADLFDQYLVYRADWLSEWEKGQQLDGLGEAQCWQAPLWAELVKYTRHLGQPEWHRANLYSRFISRLEQSSARPPGLPDRVFIFGISALPPVYLQALQALGKHIDIHLLFTNPCRYYWGDVQDYSFMAKPHHRRRRHFHLPPESGLLREADVVPLMFSATGEQQLSHPLLASWGKSGRDNLFLLTQMEPQEVDAFVDITPDTLLHTLQHDMLELEDKSVIGVTAAELADGKKKRWVDPKDTSFSLHICHSPQREVEVLQDRLLAMMEDNPQLAPRDIIVMVADIDSYTPAIQAVFGNASAQRYIPFSISDQRASQMHPVVQAFITLLNLPDSRFHNEEILTLLELPALAGRFNIDEPGLHRLRQWVAEAGIRWGLDDDNVRQLALPTTGQHTWKFGLTRMLLGYAMESGTGDWHGILPYDESSGLIAELAGYLAELLLQLTLWRQRLLQARPLEEWLPLCRLLLDTFFIADANTEAALALITDQWQQVINQGIQARYQQAVTLNLLRDEITSRLDQQRVSQRFLAGQLNFCTLMPMRSIPFKVVCLLGMNDGVYPRTLPPLGFDLMSQQPRKGDRSRRNDDRYLFLEALLSAQEKLYISYIGRSIQDNTLRNPSVLVSELIDYIAQSFYLPGDEKTDIDISAQRVRSHLQHQHSRMPFAVENFVADSKFCSFAQEWFPAATGSGKPLLPFAQPLAVPELNEISLTQLLRFWRHPVRAFFNFRLGVSFSPDESALPETEPFSPDTLQRFRINSQLLNALIEGGQGEEIFSHHRAAGDLPYGAFGEICWQSQYAEMLTLAKQVSPQRQDSHSIEINLQIDDVVLNGWLQQVQKDGILRWRAGILNFNDGVMLWLEHLIYCAVGGKGRSRMYGRKASEWIFNALTQEEAMAWLRKYIQGYRQGLCIPLLLLAKTGGAWLNACYDKTTSCLLTDEESRVKARYKLLQVWQGNIQQQGERNDPYLQRLLRPELEDEQIQQICHIAEQWLCPLLRFKQSE